MWILKYIDLISDVDCWIDNPKYGNVIFMPDEGMLLFEWKILEWRDFNQPLLRDGGAEKLRKDPTVWPNPKVWTRDLRSSAKDAGALEKAQMWVNPEGGGFVAPTNCRLTVMLQSPPLPSGG